jgi:DMSO reductase anchor subunit
MHPASSVVFFTTASGTGYGMLVLLGALTPVGLLPAHRWFGGVSLGLALVLVTLGLLSSTLHLHHPERAWRAFSQWRSSWLSREGVLALVTFVPAVGFATGWLYREAPSTGWGMLVSMLAVATIISTSMIYASLRSIPQWHHRLVPPVYVILGVASGAVWLVGVAAATGVIPPVLLEVALGALMLGAAAKLMYWHAIDGATPQSDAGTATGLGGIGTVRQLEAPHGVDNWVLREMGFSVARKHARKLRRTAGVLGFALPLLCLAGIAADVAPIVLAWLAVVSVSIGVVVERWLFFAEARHVVGLYYGR